MQIGDLNGLKELSEPVREMRHGISDRPAASGALARHRMIAQPIYGAAHVQLTRGPSSEGCTQSSFQLLHFSPVCFRLTTQMPTYKKSQ